MLDSFRIQNYSFIIRVSGADEDGGVPIEDGGLRRSRCGGWGKFWILDVGWWIHSEFKIAHSKFGFLVPTRTAAFRSGWMVDWRRSRCGG
jgi:hypothetical protein